MFRGMESTIHIRIHRTKTTITLTLKIKKVPSRVRGKSRILTIIWDLKQKNLDSLSFTSPFFGRRLTPDPFVWCLNTKERPRVFHLWTGKPRRPRVYRVRIVYMSEPLLDLDVTTRLIEFKDSHPSLEMNMVCLNLRL